MPRLRAFSAALLLAIVCHALPARAAAGGRVTDPESLPRPVARAFPASSPIDLDGRLDEAAWRTATSFGDFVQSQPRAGEVASLRTEVRLLYDDDALYVGAWLVDDAPEKLVVTTLERDFESLNGDAFGVALDTFRDGRTSFIFIVNPRGAIRDGQGFDDGASRNYAWDSVVRVKTQILADGWSVEMAIPWTTLRFDPHNAEPVWGVNFVRRVRRINEESYWAPLDRRDPLYTMSKAGTVVGLHPGKRSRDLRLTPYAAATHSTGGASADARHQKLDAGLDFKYAVTSHLTLDLSYRTDFSHVEVDQEQINLTRFSLFFPEQRDFFTENSGIFAFGDVADPKYRLGTSLRDFSLFHSRRVGLTAQGAPIPVIGGARLTGRVGPFELGVLNVQTGRAGETPPENFSVVRVRRRLSARSDVGFMLTHRAATRDEATNTNDRSVGIDVNLWPVRPLWIHTYVAASDRAGRDRENLAGRVLFAWRDRFWSLSGLVRHVGGGFDPGVGFVERVGIEQAFATLGVHARPRMRLLQEVNPYLELDYITDSHARPDTRDRTVGVVAEFRDGATLNMSASDRDERISNMFRVSGGGVVVPGEYQLGQRSMSYRSNAGQPLYISVSLSEGGYYGGHRRSMAAKASWRANYRLTMDLSVNRNAVALPSTRIAADLFAIKVKYAHTTNLSGSAFVQYNRASRQIITDYRLNLIHSPLSHLYIVFNDRRDVLSIETRPQRSLAVKVTRMIAF